ncbi:tenascin XB-like protein, partial [Reticulomyxa filosa]
FGSGGGSSSDGLEGGRGGGIIHIIIQQQLINHGLIRANGGFGDGDSDGLDGGGGGGSGGSILLEFSSSSSPISTSSSTPSLPQTLGSITCRGGRPRCNNFGGHGRIAIYGLSLTSQDIQHITPTPFHQLHKPSHT